MVFSEKWKTAFHIYYGLYEYTVIPFSLYNAPSTFQYYVNDIFHDYMDDFITGYLNNVLIFSATLKEHKVHVHKVLQRLEEHQLYLKPSKYEFHKTQIIFLSYIIFTESIMMNSEKVSAVIA